MLKSVLKCIEYIGIKKNGSNKFQISRANLGGGGVRPSWSKAFFLPFPNTYVMIKIGQKSTSFYLQKGIFHLWKEF